MDMRIDEARSDEREVRRDGEILKRTDLCDSLISNRDGTRGYGSINRVNEIANELKGGHSLKVRGMM
jgi:hypothetical protein